MPVFLFKTGALSYALGWLIYAFAVHVTPGELGQVALGVLIFGLHHYSSKKQEQIHLLVNSNLTQVKTDLENANTKITSLETTIIKLQNILTPSNSPVLPSVTPI